MAEKSKVLIIGGTGYIGKFIVEASAKAGHPTFALVRESTLSNPDKTHLIQIFKNSGVTILYGDLYDHESLVKAIKQVDVVIYTLRSAQAADQAKIIAAIKEVGNIKIPTVRIWVRCKSAPCRWTNWKRFGDKAKIRREVEAERIPYTYVSSFASAGYFLHNLGQLNATTPPRDKVVILGDGNVKAVYVVEEDIGTYTIKAVDDPRTLNKILYLRPPANILTFNEIVVFWEKKIGKILEKTYVPEDQILKKIKEVPFLSNFGLALSHALLVKGDTANFEIEASLRVEGSELYPEVKYIRIGEFLDQYV